MIRQPLRSVVFTVACLVLAVSGAFADFLVEDWTKYPVGTRGIPPGWEAQRWGSPLYDFSIEQNSGRNVLHLKSKNESSTISKDIKGKVDLRETPILEWSWKAVTLPLGGDSRKKDLDDQAAQIFVAWPRFPEMVRSRVIGYVWDTTVPAGTVAKSEKTGTVTYIVVRSGQAELGKWITERRNVREDFRKVYGEEPENPAAVSISIDSNDTRSVAESFFGPIAFRAR
jgi:hypothetical protein